MSILVAVVIAYGIVALILNLWFKKRHQNDTEDDLNFNQDQKAEEDVNEFDEEQSSSSEDEKSEEKESIHNEECQKKETDKMKVSVEVILPMAQEAKTELEAEYVLSQNWCDQVQVALAKTGKFECQKVLITSSKLCGEALVEICTNPASFNFDNNTVQNWFERAVNETNLNANQEIKIARAKEFIIKRALILRKNITPEGLVALCQNTGKINMDDSCVVYDWFKRAIVPAKLTCGQELKIAQTRQIASVRALLLRKKINGKTLLAICENPPKFDMDNQIVWDLFEQAFRNANLTPEQEVRMAKTGLFPIQRGLILRKDLTFEGFLEICKNPKHFNMENSTVKGYFEDAARNISSKITDDQKVELAKCKIESVIKGLI